VATAAFPLDGYHLARVKFAFIERFHIVFPAFSIASHDASVAPQQTQASLGMPPKKRQEHPKQSKFIQDRLGAFLLPCFHRLKG
jgi:hypothetical protein